MSVDLPLTGALSPLAAQLGVDLTPLALREQAFNRMVKHAQRGGPEYDEAKRVFHNLDPLRGANSQGDAR